MTTIDESIEVGVDVRQAYNQWTQFEKFPEFMDDVEDVKQLDETHLRWTVSSGHQRQQWEAVITEQIPDQRIAWRVTSGKLHEGQVTFDKIGEDRTRVHVQIAFEPQSLREKMADALGLVSSHVKRNLERFKSFIEGRRQETGAWRGEVHDQQVVEESGPAAGSKRSRS